jgi:cardiolipin synthase
MQPAAIHGHQWLKTGDEAFAAMLDAIRAASKSIRLEIYIFAAAPLGFEFRNALVEARKRGVAVRVMVDSFGSFYLSDSFWRPLRDVGGQVRWFNPMSLERFGFRDHRKLLVCDDAHAFVGGFNIAPEYQGDGVHNGWRDLGLRLTGPLVAELARSFDLLYERADLRHQRFARLRKPRLQPTATSGNYTVLHNGPGRGFSSFRRMLHKDLAQGTSARIISAYFLPTWRIRRDLFRMARHGGRVQLLLAGKSDVPAAQLACQRLYTPMLKAGIEIYEYQPQILHAKLIVIDSATYVGSANVDVRSLRINYDLMLRLEDPAIAAEATNLFMETLDNCRRVDPRKWAESRSLWQKFKERWYYFLLARVDPYIARRQLKWLR